MKLKHLFIALTAMLWSFSLTANAQVAKIGETTYEKLQAALEAAAAGTGNVTVEILADVDLTGSDWNPVTVSGPGYPVVTVEGNDKTITGLNDMLFAGTWAGKSGLIIKNLTIDNAAIVNDKDDAKGNVGVGAFIGYPQASATITLEDCHLTNSSVEGGHWTGGLIGMAGGYNGNDGPVFMNLTITGCSVTGSTITGKGSVGGIIGHGSCSAWTNVVIEETTVSGNIITSTGSSTVKAGAVMGTIGAAGQSTTVNGETKTGGATVSATVAGNTVTSNGTAITTIYGRQGTETGMLYVAGGSYDNYPVEKNVAYAAPIEGYEIVKNADGTYGAVEKTTEVATYDELVVALANGGKIKLTADITVDSRITAIDGTELDLNQKTLYINVENSYYNNVTIKNGNIVLGKDDAHVCDGYFLVNAGKTLVIDNVNVSSSAEGIKGYAVFHLKTSANLDLLNSTLNIADNEYSAGYIVYAGEATATVDVRETTITGSNVNGIVHASTVIDESIVTLTDVTEHGINRSGVTINNSEVAISGGAGRGITAQHGDLVITGTSTVDIKDMGESTIELRNNKNLSIAETATVTLDAAVNNTTSGTISGTVNVTVPAVAKIGDTPYCSLSEALADAKTKNLSEVVITIIGENTAATADKFNLYQASVFNKVTFKQENGNKPYYFEELYTGSRTDNGQFVFDGVNLVVTGQGQYIFEGNVVLSNNSLIKSTAEANCFVYYAEVTVEAGSKIDGVIEDIRGGSLIIDGGKTDGTYCETPGLRDAILVVNWANSNLVLRNGAYVNINAANEIGRLTVTGTLDVTNSKLDSYQWIKVNGSMKLNAGSLITTQQVEGAGNITIDATGMVAGDVNNFKANFANFAGTLEVINNDKLEAKIVDGKIVLAAKPVAKIGDTPYETLQAALEAVQEGETITILAGTIEEGTIKLPATLKNVTFKGEEGAILKDMTISAADGNAYSYVDLTFDGITFDNSRILLTGWRNGDETIKNLAVTNCTFKNLNDNTNTAPIHINKDASEAVNGFTFTNNVIDGATGGSKSGIYAQVTGEVKVENNIINNVSFRPYVIQVTTDDGIADNFTVKGNTFSGSAVGRAQGLGNNAEGTDNVNLVVSNNIFKGITEAQQICYWNFNPKTTTADLSKNYYDIDIVANPSKIYFNSAAADNYALRDMNVFPIYTALNEDGTINTESAFTPKFYIAKIGDTPYYSLSEAVAAAQNGDEIVLTADVKTTDGVVITDKNLTIDLNGKTYTVTEGANTNNRNFKINGTSVVTVKNGTMVAAGEYSSGAYGTIRTEGTANVTLIGLKLYNYRGNGLNIKACAGTTVTIENTEIYANYGGGIESAGGTIVVNNGVTVEQKGMYTAPYNSMAISVNGGGKVTVNGGTFSTECITAEEADNQGTSHGPWVAGVLNSGGTLIINGGTFSNDNFGENSLATAARGAILADTKAKVEINGGTFNVLQNVIDIQNNLGDANNNPSVLLVGGTYSADPRISAQYGSNLITLAEGYICQENGDGTYSVIAGPNYIPELEIDDAEGKVLAEHAGKTVGTLTYVRELSTANVWQPLYVPFGIQLSEELLANFDIAYFNAVMGYDDNNDQVTDRTIIEVIKIENANTALKANYPLIIRAKSAEKTAFELTMENVTMGEAEEHSVICESVSHTYEIKGTYREYASIAANQRVLGLDEDGKVAWGTLREGYSLKPYRLILTINSRENADLPFAGAIRMRVVGEEDEDGATAIYDVEVEEQGADRIFDLQGRRVLEPQKGNLYIINGKKVVIK